MVESDLPWSSIGRYCKLLQDNGLWHPQEPIDENGASLAAKFIFQLTRQGRTETISDEEWGQILGPAPANVWDTTFSRRSLAAFVLESVRDQKPSANHPLWNPIVWEQLPTAALKAMKPPYNGEPSEKNVMVMLLKQDQLELVPLLLQRGWTWKDQVGCSIVSKQGWELFLKTGGDPHEIIAIGEPWEHHHKQVPLWQFLLEASHPSEELKNTLKEWAKANVADALKEKELKDYWTRLGRANTSVDVQKAVRALPNWHELRNELGQSPLLVAVHKNVSAVEALGKTAKGVAALKVVDANGWNLWHHLLADSRKFSKQALALASEHVPVRSDENKGLLVTLYTNIGSHSSQFFLTKNLITDTLAPSRKGAPSAEDWWAGSQEDLEKVARHWMGPDHYLGSFSSSGPSPADGCLGMAELVRNFPLPDGAPALLKGALALNELITANYRGGSDRYGLCDQWIAEGATLEMSEKFQQALEKALAGRPESLSRYRELVLNSSLEAAPTKSRPRM